MMQSEQLKELEKLAASDSPCPKDLEPPETMLFYMLSGLYAQYHSKRISKEEAQKRKSLRQTPGQAGMDRRPGAKSYTGSAGG